MTIFDDNEVLSLFGDINNWYFNDKWLSLSGDIINKKCFNIA